MRDFIITTILALAAAKAESQVQGKLDNQKVSKKLKFRNQLEATREVDNYMGHRINFKKDYPARVPGICHGLGSDF